DLPPGVHALHLEHRQDLVPALEGVANPDTPQRTTVVRDLAASPAPQDRAVAGSVARAHGLDAYLRTAQALQGSGDPSLEGFDAAVRAVLGSAASTATSTVYQGVRVLG
ncbi:MAG TPA: hypothetical protein VN257_01105, partial [Actinotalea sp.]|nr:hypothetical protein [Actinotalea sp.]